MHQCKGSSNIDAGHQPHRQKNDEFLFISCNNKSERAEKIANELKHFL
jgi:hypothetical protein